MSAKKIQVNLPIEIFEVLQQTAEASGWTFDRVLLQAIKSGLPPSLAKVPQDFQEELWQLNRMSDRELLGVVEGNVPGPGKLDARRKKADFNTLRRTYALYLLRWRGHPVPKAYEAIITS